MPNYLMIKFLGVLVFSSFIVCGAAFLVWARALSVRHNDWTTRLRERHPQLSPPPTPEWRARNTTIMMWTYRAVGAALAVESFRALINILGPR
jgi:hypothetical protein